MHVISRHFPEAVAAVAAAVHVIARCYDGHLVSGVIPRSELSRNGLVAAIRAIPGADETSVRDLVMIHVESTEAAARADRHFYDDLHRFGDARLWQLILASDGQ